MKKIIIIDGNSLAYSRIPDVNKGDKKALFAASDNRDIFIVRKFIKRLLRLKYVIYGGYQLIVVFDEQDKVTFRHKLDKKYKAKSLSEKRKAQKDYVYKQINEIKDVLKRMNIPTYSSINWEADDIIGMLVKKFEERNMLSTIVTGDKDILQLISNKTRIHFTNNNNESILVTRNNIWEVSGGVWPDQVIDIKMIAGDSSDNIKGIGIIKEGKIDYWTSDEATEHIKRWNSIDNMLTNIDKIKEPYKESLIRGKDKLEFNKKLVTIVKDWSIDKDIKYFLNKNVNNEETIKIMEDLNLENLLKNKRFSKNFYGGKK